MGWNMSNILVNEAIANKKAGGGSNLDTRVSALETSVSALETEVSELYPNVYSETETPVGKWKNETLYRKLVPTGALPSIGSGDIASGLTNITIHNLYGCVSSTTRAFNIQKSAAQAVSDGIELTYDYELNVIRISVGTDRSSYSGDIVIEYTKNPVPEHNTRKGGKK